MITDKLAEQLYGSDMSPIGQVIKISGLPFTIIGTFKERVNTFGRSELTPDTVVIPYTVSRFFLETDSVKQLYFSVVDSTMVVPATRQIRDVIHARHRPESIYVVDNLTQLIGVAGKTAGALTLMLLLIATVTLLVSGTGIMNIMLATVSARTQEIGIRKALGATNRTILLQFLTEAIFISLVGGIIGVIIGLGLPFSLRLFTDYTIPISGGVISDYCDRGLLSGRHLLRHVASNPSSPPRPSRQLTVRIERESLAPNARPQQDAANGNFYGLTVKLTLSEIPVVGSV